MEPYGSFVSNLFTRSGDLDISVELTNGSFISSSGKKERQRLLKALMRAMRRRGRNMVSILFDFKYKKLL